MNIYLLWKKGLIDRHCYGLLRLCVHFLFIPSEKYRATSVSLPFNQRVIMILCHFVQSR